MAVLGFWVHTLWENLQLCTERQESWQAAHFTSDQKILPQWCIEYGETANSQVLNLRRRHIVRKMAILFFKCFDSKAHASTLESWLKYLANSYIFWYLVKLPVDDS